MDQTKLRETVLSFLESHRKAVLATCTNEGKPSTSLMLYSVNENLEMHFGTRKQFGKYHNLREHPHVSLTVAEEELDPLRAVEIRGDVEFLSDDDSHVCLQWFEEKNPSKYYVKDCEDFIMFKIKPYFVRWMDATSGELVMEHLDF